LTLIFVPLLLLYLRQQSKFAHCAFYGFQAALLLGALCAGLLVSESEVRSLTKYFFQTEYWGWNNKPFIRCGGFIVGYNLGIIFYQFKK
jgi:hypothetical protein